METAIQQLRNLWDAEQYKKALKLAASWRRLGAEGDTIRGGWAAVSNPRFYRQLNRDPDAMYRAALAALVVRYKLSPMQEES